MDTEGAGVYSEGAQLRVRRFCCVRRSASARRKQRARTILRQHKRNLQLPFRQRQTLRARKRLDRRQQIYPTGGFSQRAVLRPLPPGSIQPVASSVALEFFPDAFLSREREYPPADQRHRVYAPL